jgi:hypothetical protein
MTKGEQKIDIQSSEYMHIHTHTTGTRREIEN